jgi:ribonuclease HI
MASPPDGDFPPEGLPYFSYHLGCHKHSLVSCPACTVDEVDVDLYEGFAQHYEINYDYKDSDDSARLEFVRDLRETTRTPPPMKHALMGTVQVALMSDSDPSLPGQKNMTNYVGGAQFKIPLRPSPAQAQSHTVQISPKMIHLARAISARPAEKQPRVGTGRVTPKKFVPPNPRDMPQVLFPLSGHRGFTSSPVPRFVRDNDLRQFLIYTDGACSNNGGLNPKGGCSFIYRTTKQQSSPEDYVRFPLESVGPTGERHTHTSNRAELRAVIAALRFRSWDKEEFDRLVIATDSDYVVKGITNWVKAWRRKGWKTRSGTPVKNKDLWQCLLGEIERADENGLRVKFWWIPREWNIEADHHAKAAVDEAPPHEFTDTIGVFS